MNEITVNAIGEQGLLGKLQAFCPPEVIGDDGAAIATPPGELIVTTDMLIDGVHFSDRTTPPEAVGWRAAAANLSDLAAMGATALGITVGLSLPGETPLSWVEQLYQGLQDCLQQYDAVILGGDVTRAPLRAISITALGHVAAEQIIWRRSAQPGDAILVSGYHGASRGGLELLLHPEQGQDLTETERHYLQQAHQRPRPRLDLISSLRSQVEPFRVAGMDSSDGLADAVLQICRASGVGAELAAAAIPLPEALQKLAGPAALEWALYGGEDFELVLCLPPERAAELVSQWGAGAAIVGRIVSGDRVELLQGTTRRTLSLEAGFQHFSA
ncbi:MAG: thiamine-phosphate kinase [Chloroflexaceae bacterium]|nr:thiamine-phosphate kinase [Chloroflexaceae bacterium]